MSISMCEKRRRAEGHDDVVGRGGVGGPRAEVRRPAARTRSSSSWAPFSVNGIRPARERREAVGVLVDPQDAQAAVGEAERERQPDPPRPMIETSAVIVRQAG